MTAPHIAGTSCRPGKALALFAAACGLAWAIPASAQSKEHISCRLYEDVTPFKQVGTGYDVDLRNGRPSLMRAVFHYGVTYRAMAKSASKPNEMVSAYIARNWPAPGSFMNDADLLTRPSYKPNLSIEMKVPVGASLSRNVIVRFLRGKTLIAEAPGRFNARPALDDYAIARLNLDLPAEVAATQGAIDVEFLAETDRRRVGSARFELSGLGETDWHRANQTAGLVLGADGGSVVSVGPTCKRTAAGR